ALQLLLGISLMTFVFFTKNFFLKIAAVGMIALSMSYVLKTGSRGVFLAAAAVAAAIFFTSHRKIFVTVLGLPLVLLSFTLASPETRNRLLFIEADSAGTIATNSVEASALGSQMQRERLLKLSLSL